MTYSLNIERYTELLRKESSLNDQKKSLLFENKEEFLELLSYGSHVESQISYDRKNLYHSLIAEYLAKTITPDKFRSKFLKMQRVLTIYSSVSIEKKFFIKELLTSYRISNQRITNIKKCFIQSVKVLE